MKRESLRQKHNKQEGDIMGIATKQKAKKRSFLLDDLIENTIDEFKREYKNYSNIENAINEIADNNVPIYYYDIAQYLANNFILGQEESEFQSKEAFKIVTDNIYNALNNALYNYVHNNNLIK